MRFSLTLILLPLMLFIASCSSIPEKENNQYKLNIEIQTSKKNKEMIIERLLKKDILFSLRFDNEDSFKLENDLIDSDMYYFCDSFIQEQRQLLESKIFEESNDKSKKILVIYSDGYEAIISDLKKKYPAELYYLLNEKNYCSNLNIFTNFQLSISSRW